MRTKPIAPTVEELQLIERLRDHPALRERIGAIVSLVEDGEGEVSTADQIEEQLIEAVRHLGQTSMEQWAQGAERRVAEQFRAQNPKSHAGKKNSCHGGASSGG